MRSTATPTGCRATPAVGFRLGLLGLFTVHILTAVRLARGKPYPPGRSPTGASHASGAPAGTSDGLQWPAVAGLPGVPPAAPDGARGRAKRHSCADDAGRIDVYGMLVVGFSQPLIVAVYLGAMGLLGMHLVHANEGMFQTLGFNHDSYQTLISVLARC